MGVTPASLLQLFPSHSPFCRTYPGFRINRTDCLSQATTSNPDSGAGGTKNSFIFIFGTMNFNDLNYEL